MSTVSKRADWLDRDPLGRALDRISVEVTPDEFARGDFTKLQQILSEELAQRPASPYPYSDDGTPHSVLLTVRAWNCLSWRFHAKDLVPAEVAKLTAKEILKMPNSGKRTLANIREWLAACGLALSGDIPS